MKKAIMSFVLFVGFAALAAPDPAKYGPALPTTVVEGSQGCSAVEISGDYLYAAGRDYLAVFDIKDNPAKPKLISTLDSVKGCRQMAIYKDKAYITARNNGLWIVDIKDPRQPKLIRRFDTIELATGIEAAENVIFVAHRVYGVQLLDVTDPRFPKHISQVRTAEAQSVVYNNGMLYVGDWGIGKLTIIDVRDLRNPEIVSRSNLDGFGDGLFVKDNLCFCSTGHNSKSGPKEDREGRGRGVEIFDVSDVKNPKKLDVFKFPRFLRRDNDYWTVRVCGTTMFCVDSHNGFYVIDASDPTNMKGIGNVQLPPPVYKWKVPEERMLKNDCCASVATGDGVVYVAGLTTGIYVIKNPASHKQPEPELRFDIPPEKEEKVNPRLMRYNLECQVRRVAVNDDFVYVAASHAGLKLFRIGKDGLKELKTWKRECVYDVAVYGDKLFAAENNYDFVVYQIAADGDLSEISRSQLERKGNVQIIHILKDGKYAVVSGGGGTAYFLDLSDLKNIKQAFKCNVKSILYGDMFPMKDADGIVPVSAHGRGLTWVDMNGKKPKLITTGALPTSSQLDGLDLLDNGLMVLPQKGGKIALVNPKLPGEFKVVDVKTTMQNMPVRGIPTVDGNIVAFASRRDGKVFTVDFSNPESPVFIEDRYYDLSEGNCDRVVFYKGRMIIPAGHYGLFMEK